MFVSKHCGFHAKAFFKGCLMSRWHSILNFTLHKYFQTKYPTTGITNAVSSEERKFTPWLPNNALRQINNMLGTT